MPTDRRWSDTDRELVAETIRTSEWDEGRLRVERAADAALDALTAAGWRPTVPTAREIAVATEGAAHAVHALIREHIAKEIAQAIEAMDFDLRIPLTRQAAAAIARAHRTTPGDDHAR